MCCFSQSVELVSDTNIFARGVNGSQFLVYSMRYAAASDLAMVLPLPVPPHPPDDAVRFINLERYPAFFKDLYRGFPPPRSSALTVRATSADATLVVHDVGAYEASFVPRIADFDRLDERFRIPREIWERLPAYHDFGFAVFKLKATAGAVRKEPVQEHATPPVEPNSWLRGIWKRWFGSQNEPPIQQDEHEILRQRRRERWRLREASPEVHPMALQFPRRNPDLLHFPTVHIHDVDVHPRAHFDHTLYCQPDPTVCESLESYEANYLLKWEKSEAPAAEFMRIDATAGIVDPEQYCWRHRLYGDLENRDAQIGKGGAIPEHASS